MHLLAISNVYLLIAGVAVLTLLGTAYLILRRARKKEAARTEG